MLFSSSPRTQYTSHAMMLWWRSIATHTKLLLNSAQHPRVSFSHSSDISFVSTKTCWERLIAALPFLIGTGQHYPESPTPALYGTTLMGSETQPVHTAASQLDHSTSLDSRPHHLPVPSASRGTTTRDSIPVVKSSRETFYQFLHQASNTSTTCCRCLFPSTSSVLLEEPAAVYTLPMIPPSSSTWQMSTVSSTAGKILEVVVKLSTMVPTTLLLFSAMD